MISHKHKYIFVHIPKCAGTSLEKCLLEHEGHEFVSKPQGPALQLLPQQVKEDYLLDIDSKQHCKLNMYDRDKQEQYFCFTFVRNPWSWAVSDYLYHKARRTVPTFDIWIQTLGDQNLFKYHMEPQNTFINNNINFIGRFEQIEKDWEHVCNILFDDIIPLPKENLCWKKYDYRDFYCPVTREFVGNLFKDDIAQFGYTFE